jgi:hypothetical protein
LLPTKLTGVATATATACAGMSAPRGVDQQRQHGEIHRQAREADREETVT